MEEIVAPAHPLIQMIEQDGLLDRVQTVMTECIGFHKNLLVDSYRHYDDRDDTAMTTADKIQQSILRLPASLQAEALDFIEYLLIKAQQQEASEWSALSLAFAMRDMADEDAPTYTPADLKVSFR